MSTSNSKHDDQVDSAKGPARDQLDVAMMSKYAEQLADQLIQPVYDEQFEPADHDTWVAQNKRAAG
ncbi:MAG: hypothetical protein GC159_12070 [Phycisphaera sp.]|nr:hypothetical protein [Phycisphaera sp.]